MQCRRVLMCALAVALGLAPRTASQVGGGPGILTPGPHPVGFTSSWQLDAGRSYATAFDEGATYGAEKSPRPILVNLWFPAKDAGAEPMPHGDYFEIGVDGACGKLAQALAEHARGIFADEVLGKPEGELDADGLAELEQLLATPTRCFRDAAPAPGPFPLVVFHSGAGSSFEDDAQFCEYLASHGYVVLGSAYPRADGTTLNVDGERGSAEDIQFLLRHARDLSFVDWKHVAVAGHSLGAQATLRYGSHPGAVADALVLLDTTQDYYGLSMPMFEGFVPEVEGGVKSLTQALLVVAGPEAQFQLADRLVNADRSYLTVPVLGHNDFISQGHQHLAVLEQRAAGNPALLSDTELAGEVRRAPVARALYAELCEYVRLFLDVHLKGQGGALKERNTAILGNTLGGEDLCLELVPRGVSDPAPYDLESAVPPTPRQFQRLVEHQGAAAACKVLERCREAKPESPIYTSTMLLGSLLQDLYATGRKEEAHVLYAGVYRFQPAVLGLFEFLADINQRNGHAERVRPLLEMGLDLDPERAGLAERLRKLEEAEREGSAR